MEISTTFFEKYTELLKALKNFFIAFRVHVQNNVH